MTYGIQVVTDDGRSIFAENQITYPVLRSGAASNPQDVYWTDPNNVEILYKMCYDLGADTLGVIDRVWQWLPPNIHVAADVIRVNGRIYLRFANNEIVNAGSPTIYFALTGEASSPDLSSGYGLVINDTQGNCIFSSNDQFQHIVITDVVTYSLYNDTANVHPASVPLSFGAHTDAPRLMVCREKTAGLYKLFYTDQYTMRSADAWWKFESATGLQVQRRTIDTLSTNERQPATMNVCPTTSCPIYIPVGVLK